VQKSSAWKRRLEKNREEEEVKGRLVLVWVQVDVAIPSENGTIVAT
jgi:hypothetical protein